MLPACTLHAQRNFNIQISNQTFFDIHTGAMPEKGEGIFINYKSAIKKGATEWYTCKQDSVLKGVEGNMTLTAYNNEVKGKVNIYFSNPAVGDLTCTINADWPYKVEFFAGPKRNLSPNAWIIITVDTATYGPADPSGIKTGGINNAKNNLDEPIPPVINFEWQVVQRMPKDEEDENNGKAYNTVTYYFMTDGSYAAVKPEDKSFSLMIYSKNGQTWMFDDKKKIITVMNMPKTVGEGGMMGKAIAEKINKAPITKDKDDETYTVTKTGKTKTILGYTAEEYQMKPDNQIATKNAVSYMSFWYIKVPFDPVKIYTMGAGRPADITKLQNDPKMKNNIFAIPILNKNYLSAENEAGGKKGVETIEIKKVNNTIYTAGYKIKLMKSLKDMFKGDDDN